VFSATTGVWRARRRNALPPMWRERPCDIVSEHRLSLLCRLEAMWDWIRRVPSVATRPAERPPKGAGRSPPGASEVIEKTNRGAMATILAVSLADVLSDEAA
jgi:hypothetical protein